MDGICHYKSSPIPTFFFILQVSNSYQNFFLALINHSKELTFCDYSPEKHVFCTLQNQAFPVFSTIVIKNASYLQSKKNIQCLLIVIAIQLSVSCNYFFQKSLKTKYLTFYEYQS